MNQVANASLPVIDRLKSELDGLISVQISTSDGHVVENHLQTGMHPNKIAAISASLVALSESTSHELGTGSANNLFIESKEGTVVALRVSTKLFLVASVRNGTNLGLVLNRTKQAAGILRNIVEMLESGETRQPENQ